MIQCLLFCPGQLIYDKIFFFVAKKRGRRVNEDYFSLFKVSQPEKRVHY